MNKKLMIACVFVFLLSACDNSLETQQAKLKDFFKNNKIGRSPDFGVVKYNFAGEREHVVSVHSFMDDKIVCEKIANMLNIQEPKAYSCEQLNMTK